MLIYHIVKTDEWKEKQGFDQYETESLHREGFIHCSFKYQIEDVLRKYFAREEKVIILHVNPHLLNAEVRVEPTAEGEFYPHVYGKINFSAVVMVEERNLF
ncbi:MAG: DUF952 domain-containing protein [Pyrinomonadaceae bacterium]|nr:DUF952 domain-containing protein [Pyrinomonadaceae bacterium]MCX7639265.1 DUF952 domain-containing protein [Pyrinomonadaceae bacterium]MDW8303513.1 DUF952 domain-containing protein [Acidobacteriota bacterium]